MNPDVTVVIPTFNRHAYLARVLSTLEKQDLPRGTFDVVVVDDGSTDDTPRVLANKYWFDLTSLRQENAGPAAARNAAINAAQGDIILFIDDDVIPAADLVRRHRDAQQQSPGVVIGRMLEPEGVRQPPWTRWEALTLERQYDKMAMGVFSASPRQFYTANASVRRDDIVRAGMFDVAYKRAEDVELAYRLGDLGLAFRFLPEATVMHDTPRTLAGWLRVAEQYGMYEIKMWREGGREHIVFNMAEEFVWFRKKPVKTLSKLALGRPLLVAALKHGARIAIPLLDRVGARSSALAVCSAIFNLLYLDAAARELGGRDAFWHAIAAYMAGPEREVSPATQ